MVRLNILETAPLDRKEWSWAPWQSHSRINPFTYLSTKKLEWIKSASRWTLLIGAVFLGAKVFFPKYVPDRVGERSFNAVLICEGIVWSAKLCILSALASRKIFEKETVDQMKS